MRLVTYSNSGAARLGSLSGANRIIDLERASKLGGGSLPNNMLAFLAGGHSAIDRARAAIASAEAALANGSAPAGLSLDLDDPNTRLLAPVERPGKAIAIGLNYRDHAAETNQEIPEQPVVFMKATTSITGPSAPVHMPRMSAELDWEAEFCFVIGEKARHVRPADALKHVAGYLCGNDFSIREWQRHARTWTAGKGYDTHGPIGPYLATADEVADPAALDIKCFVNGVEKQSSNTGQLIFDVPFLVSYLSTAFTLEPGDVVFTGTPGGVGNARRPKEFLKVGDTVRVEITGLGVLENTVVEEPR